MHGGKINVPCISLEVYKQHASLITEPPVVILMLLMSSILCSFGSFHTECIVFISHNADCVIDAVSV